MHLEARTAALLVCHRAGSGEALVDLQPKRRFDCTPREPRLAYGPIKRKTQNYSSCLNKVLYSFFYMKTQGPQIGPLKVKRFSRWRARKASLACLPARLPFLPQPTGEQPPPAPECLRTERNVGRVCCAQQRERIVWLSWTGYRNESVTATWRNQAH